MRDNRIEREVAERVLEELHRQKPTEEFSSHDFIQEYCRQNEGENVDWLVRYREADGIFRTVHSQIAYFLSKNIGDLQPQYHKTERRESKTVHGTMDGPMWFA